MNILIKDKICPLIILFKQTSTVKRCTRTNANGVGNHSPNNTTGRNTAAMNVSNMLDRNKKLFIKEKEENRSMRGCFAVMNLLILAQVISVNIGMKILKKNMQAYKKN